MGAVKEVFNKCIDWVKTTYKKCYNWTAEKLSKVNWKVVWDKFTTGLLIFLMASPFLVLAYILLWFSDNFTYFKRASQRDALFLFSL
ncbi:MAG: hypothetical protein J6K44_01055 [Clostridia bacterium]|nr:hypothetical protein [Clostridia bacterium]